MMRRRDRAAIRCPPGQTRVILRQASPRSARSEAPRSAAAGHGSGLAAQALPSPLLATRRPPRGKARGGAPARGLGRPGGRRARRFVQELPGKAVVRFMLGRRISESLFGANTSVSTVAGFGEAPCWHETYHGLLDATPGPATAGPGVARALTLSRPCP